MATLRFLKNFGILFLFALLCFGAYVWFQNTMNYYDPFSGCKISISITQIGGNRNSIQSALRQIKTTDPAAYGTVCKSVDQITEDWCLIADVWTPTPIDSTLSGCYIKGTKTVILQPKARITEDELTALRAKALVKYANFSLHYWQTH